MITCYKRMRYILIPKLNVSVAAVTAAVAIQVLPVTTGRWRSTEHSHGH